jgi:intracellular multiplication protein IcmC
MAADISEMMRNLDTSLPQVEKLVIGFAFLLGIGFCLRAVYRFKIYGEARTMMSSQTSIKEPLFLLFIGAVFLYIPTGLKIFNNTAFGYETPLAYSQWAARGSVNNITASSIFDFVKIMGLISFVKGWYMLSKASIQSGAQGNTFGKSMTHIIGGILAINIVGTMNIVMNTLGLSIGG